MPRDPRKHGNCLEKGMWQGSTFTIRPQKNKAIHPGGKVSPARSERWRENNNPDLFSFSCAKETTKQDSLFTHGEILPFELKKIAFGSHREREGEEKVWPYGLHSGDLHAEDLGSVSSSAYRLHQQSGVSYCLSLLLLSQRTEKIGQGK